MDKTTHEAGEPTRRTAIIAGSGQLPIAVAQALIKSGELPFIIALRGDANQMLYNYPHLEISIVELKKLISTLKKNNVRNIVLAGGVRSRPSLKDLRLDLPTLKALPKLFNAMSQGDDALLRAFISVMESNQFNVIGAHEIVPDLIARKDTVKTQRKISRVNKRDIELAAKAAKLLGALDIGQAAVACSGRVVAVEGAEGTDNMLDRIMLMRQEKRIPERGGVLVKRAKPKQEVRVDLPTIGVDTARKVADVKLDGIAIEADRSFILDIEQVIALANNINIFITTFDDIHE